MRREFARSDDLARTRTPDPFCHPHQPTPVHVNRFGVFPEVGVCREALGAVQGRGGACTKLRFAAAAAAEGRLVGRGGTGEGWVGEKVVERWGGGAAGGSEAPPPAPPLLPY